jgi:hypothetical protein
MTPSEIAETLRERQCDAYESRGATLQLAVLTPALNTDGCWVLFAHTPTEAYAEELIQALRTNNDPATVKAFRLDEAVAAEVYVYPNGQTCSGIITLNPPGCAGA